MAEETEAVHIRVTGKQIGITIATLAAIAGSYPLANSVSSNVRADPFTGADGQRLELQIHELQSWRNDHIIWGRDRSIKQSGINERHEAQIQELYNNINNK